MDTWIRYFHVIFNLLFILIGCLFISFGVYFLLGSPVHEFLNYVNDVLILIYSIVAVGGALCFMGVCGILGSCYKSECLLITYLILNVLILLAQIALLTFTIVEKDVAKRFLGTAWQNLNNETKFIIQERFNCCGYENQEEWKDAIPTSCLNNTNTEEPNTIWTVPCYKSVFQFFDENIILAMGIGGLVILLEIFQMIVTGLMIHDLNAPTQIDNQKGYHNDVREDDDTSRISNG